MSRRGWMSPISQTDLVSQLESRENRQPLSGDSAAYSVLQLLQRINPQRDVVFYPWSLGILSGRFPGILSPFYCDNAATSSYAAVSVLHNFAESVYGQTIDPKDLFKQRMEIVHHNAMTLERIRILFDTGSMSWFVSTRLYPDLPMEEQVGQYYIYRKPL